MMAGDETPASVGIWTESQGPTTKAYMRHVTTHKGNWFTREAVSCVRPAVEDGR